MDDTMIALNVKFPEGMPILLPKGMLPLPWPIIFPHRERAYEIHGQSLIRLAERGGLSALEICSLIEENPFSIVDETEAVAALAAVVQASAQFPASPIRTNEKAAK